MKHMVNNRMFAKPLSLNAIGAAAGLSAPRSMLALRGKTIYDSAGTATVIPTTGTVSLFSFENKTFTSPVQTVIFKSGGTISEAGKNVSLGSTIAFEEIRMGDGNNLPFYVNISVISDNSFSYYYDDKNLGGRIILGVTSTPKTTSHYFSKGLSGDIKWYFYNIISCQATITNTATYTNIQNYIYSNSIIFKSVSYVSYGNLSFETKYVDNVNYINGQLVYPPFKVFFGNGDDLPFYFKIQVYAHGTSSAEIIVGNLNNVRSMPSRTTTNLNYYFSRGFIGDAYIEVPGDQTYVSISITNHPWASNAGATTVDFIYP
jgi:hypothetical protein